jgi:hypothetical protein
LKGSIQHSAFSAQRIESRKPHIIRDCARFGTLFAVRRSPLRSRNLLFVSGSRSATTVKLGRLPPKKKSLPQESAAPRPQPASGHAEGKGRIFLIDTMSFIFRAYHAMARQRPMSTKTGVPTAATYVVVNMLR